MNDDPVITFIASPNLWPYNLGRKAICRHIEQGHKEGTRQEFLKPDNVSAHYAVNLDGSIDQFVDTKYSAWGNGIVTIYDSSVGWLAAAVKAGVNPNLLTISIEHEGLTGQAMPEAQYQASLWLHKKILTENPSIDIENDGLIGHNQIDGINRKFCPGSGFDAGRMFQDLLSWKKGQAAPPPEPFNPNPKNFNVGSGVLSFLADRRLTAGTDEQFFNPESGALGKRSFTYPGDGSIVIAYQSMDENGQPTGAWDIHRYMEVKE